MNGERGGLDNPLQIRGLGTLVLGKMSASRMQMKPVTWRNRQPFCPVVGEQNQTTACSKHSYRALQYHAASRKNFRVFLLEETY